MANTDEDQPLLPVLKEMSMHQDDAADTQKNLLEDIADLLNKQIEMAMLRDDMEKAKEQQAQQEGGATVEGVTPAEKKKKGLFAKIIERSAFFLTIGTLFGIFMSQFIIMWKNLQLVGKWIKSVNIAIFKFLTKGRTASQGIKNLVTNWTRSVEAVKDFGDIFMIGIYRIKDRLTAAWMKKVIDPLKHLWNQFIRVEHFFRDIRHSFGGVVRAAGESSKFVKTLTAFIKAVAKTLGTLINPFKVFFKAARSIMRFAEKAFVPLTIIMSIFDGILGFLSGFKASEAETLWGKIQDGLSGGIAGIINGIFGIPLDMLKTALGWILGKLGFTDIEEWLKGFSFVKVIEDFVDAVTHPIQWFKDMIQKFKDAFPWLFGGKSRDIDNLTAEGHRQAVNVTGEFENQTREVQKAGRGGTGKPIGKTRTISKRGRASRTADKLEAEQAAIEAQKATRASAQQMAQNAVAVNTNNVNAPQTNVSMVKRAPSTRHGRQRSGPWTATPSSLY